MQWTYLYAFLSSVQCISVHMFVSMRHKVTLCESRFSTGRWSNHDHDFFFLYERNSKHLCIIFSTKSNQKIFGAYRVHTFEVIWVWFGVKIIISYIHTRYCKSNTKIQKIPYIWMVGFSIWFCCPIKKLLRINRFPFKLGWCFTKEKLLWCFKIYKE